MKAYLIKASAPGPFKDYKRAMGAPPQNIFSLAAATPAGVEVELCDETIGMKPRRRPDADVVVLMFHTPDAVHAYAMADRYREAGTPVVLGGLHASFMPDEAEAHADALLIGEAEGVWEELLADLAQGRLRPRYERTEPVELATVRPYPTDLIPPSRYGWLWSVLVSRGCMNRCEFCTIPPFFQTKQRQRPIEDIVTEIRSAPKGCWVELHSDNLTSDRAYALALFEALEPLGIRWFGETTSKLADDEELLEAAARSGCQALLIGIESSSAEALRESGKAFVRPDSMREKIRRFHDHGIQVTSTMIFGFDSPGPEIFDETLAYCREIGIDEVQPAILIPFAGTPLYQRLDAEGRILTRDWSKYDGNHAVFQPQRMSPQELEEGATRFWYALAGTPPGRTGGGTSPRLTTGGLLPPRWRSIAALLGIGTGLVLGLPWIWGVLFLVWFVMDVWYGRTYLLDEIPRAESPILYALVVLLWLGLGIWTLVENPYAPDTSSAWRVRSRRVEGPVSPTAAFASSPKESGRSPSPVDAAASADPRTYANARFGLRMALPPGWKGTETEGADYTSLDVRAPSDAGSLGLIAMDFAEDVTVDQVVDLVELELAADLPFLHRDFRQRPSDPVPKLRPSPFRLFEYAGILDGHPVRALVGYGAGGTCGYAVVGVYGERDEAIRRTLARSLESLRIEEPTPGGRRDGGDG